MILELKDLINDTIDLDDTEIEELTENTSLTSSEMGIDSIDILELTVAIERKYKIKIADKEIAKMAFQNLNSLADFILEKKQSN